jgi:hypothetical protein
MANVIFQEPGTDATFDFSFYAATAGTVASTSLAHTGPRAIELNTNNPAVNASVSTPTGIFADAGRRLSFWFRFDTNPGANRVFFDLLNGSAANVGQLRLNAVSALNFFPTGSASSTSGTTVLDPNTWYRITLAYTITNTTTWRFEVYLNGSVEISIDSTGTLTNTGTSQGVFRIPATWGTSTKVWFDDIYIDDGTDYSDTGDVRVTAKLPIAENVNGFDTAVGAARGATDYTNVNERGLSETNGWEHRGVGFVAAGALQSTTTNTCTITAPACSVNDILIAFLYTNSNIAISAPDGTWTEISQANNTSTMRHAIFWKRATASGGNFSFTRVSGTVLFAGIIGAWKGCRTDATPIDATAATVSGNASSDTVTYADFNPTESNAFVIAAGFYANDLTTAGAFSGTDPTCTNRIDVETSTGADCSIFVYDGVSSGAATGARTHSTTSTADAVNTGVLFGLVPQAQENYTLEAASVGDVNLTGQTLLGRTAWLWGKASATTGSPTAAIVDDGGTTSITLTTSSALYTAITTSASYPSNAAGIGMRSTGTVNDTFLYECGTIISYIVTSALKDIIAMGFIPFAR